jgi:hypothetical protein
MRLLSFILLVLLVFPAPAQVFRSGSSGIDGDLIFSGPPSARREFAMAFDSERDVLVVFGGRDGSAHNNETWEFDGTNWSNRSASLLSAPSVRADAEMVFDSRRNVLVLFGGHNGTVSLADTWEYDGSDWTRVQPASSPPARAGHAFAFDFIRRVCVLFGGAGTIASLNDTWEFDGNTWRQIFRENVPEARKHAKLAYDPSRFQAVLFGGEGVGGPLGDTWIYDGTDWSPRSPANAPPARSRHGMAYDSTRQLIVLFGGLAGSEQNDTWVYDSNTWALLSPATVPPARADGEVAYDSGRDMTILFGGVASDDELSDTWEFDAASNWTKPNSVESDIIFDMRSRADGIWHFSSIHIPQGIRVSFLNNARNTAVTWLVSGNVNIAGELILDGADGNSIGLPGTEAVGGPGGGNGGLGGARFDISADYAGSAGAGFGGGAPGANEAETGGDAGHVSDGAAPRGGVAYGSNLLQPLSAGSGGGGGGSTASANGGGGGAGGGAIFIAADGNLVMNGIISALGGDPAGNGGRGSGGGVRLAATTLSGNGQIDTSGGAAGRIRLEGFSMDFTGSATPAASTAPPVLSPPNDASIVITDIAGQTAPALPGGALTTPDIVFEEAGPVTITLASSGLPLNTAITVRIAAAGQLIHVQSTPTDGDGNATATATVPAGVGVVSAYAEW